MRSKREYRLGRTLARMLRHAPEDYGIELDQYGWAYMETVVEVINRRKLWPRYPWTCVDLVEWTIHNSERFEVNDDAVRACYGHSLPVETGVARDPPSWLYHGTAVGYVSPIMRTGLRPRGRNQVHLSADPDYALAIAAAYSGFGATLLVNAKAAFQAGITFLQATQHVWQVSHVPAEFIENRM